MLKHKCALITGINGFTGIYIANELRKSGCKVYGLSNSSSLDQNFFSADLNDKKRLEKIIANITPDYIVHLAAKSFVAHKNANEFYETNLIGTRNLLQAIWDSNKIPKLILLASTANVYGNNPIEYLNEDTRCYPANDYAVSKLAMEQMAQLWIDRLPIIITRPFNYTGIGQSTQFLLPKIINHFKEKKPYIELGNIDVRRDFSDVRDVAKLYVKLLELSPVGEIYNICSGKTYSIQEIIAFCHEITNHKPEIRINPQFVRNNEIKTLCGDPTKLMQTTKFDSNLYNLRETLAWVLNDG